MADSDAHKSNPAARAVARRGSVACGWVRWTRRGGCAGWERGREARLAGGGVGESACFSAGGLVGAAVGVPSFILEEEG